MNEEPQDERHIYFKRITAANLLEVCRLSVSLSPARRKMVSHFRP